MADGMRQRLVQAESDALGSAIARATDALLGLQRPDGHWVFELEADATIPAEYVLLQHYLDEIDDDLNRRIGRYLRRIQGEHGGWPLFHGGDVDLSCTVKAYFALKAIGDDPDAPHMARARAVILACGGAARANVFTRTLLRALRRGAVASRAGDAGRDHEPAELVSFPSRQGLLLDAHGAGAASRRYGEAAAGAQPARRHDPRGSSSSRPKRFATG